MMCINIFLFMGHVYMCHDLYMEVIGQPWVLVLVSQLV